MIQFKASKSTVSSSAWIIDIHQVVKEYHSLAGDITALKGIDLQIKAGEFVVITGKSGSGKTTLVNMIAALDRATAGELWVDGMPIHQLSSEKASTWRGQAIGVVFQTFELMPTLTLVQNVMMPMDFAGHLAPKERRQRALKLLEEMEIGGHAHKRPSAISGGQQQRVAIARALANDPPIIIADEPTGSLDTGTSQTVINVFKNLSQQGKTVILVTHDADIARQSQRVIKLLDGQVIEDGNPLESRR
jgi:putative ABC transport system ATP-binding protein